MYKLYSYAFLLVLGILGFTITLSAQKQITHQSQYWLRYYGKYRLSPASQVDLEIDDRRFFKNNRQSNWVLPRITLLQKLGAGWSAGVGFTYYTSTNPADPSKPETVTVPELRPHEELDYKQTINRLSISHRFKLEERWTRNASGTKLVDGYNFKARFRYQLQLQLPLLKEENAPGGLSAKLSDETMLNLGHSVVQNTFDQNRLYFALNYEISRSFQAELGYLDYFQQRSSGNQYYQRNIARFTLYHTVSLYRKH